MENIFWQRASGMSCAATIAEKHRRFKTSGNLTRGQEKITMTCFIKMNARTGAIRSTKRRGQRDSRLTSLEEMLTAFEAFKKEALTEKKGCKRKDSQPERIYGLAVSAE